MDALWQDVRYAARTLARSPGFTAISLLVLALAVALNTAIFSVVNALIFVTLPVPNASELRFIYPFDPNTPPRRDPDSLRHHEFETLRAGHPALAALAGYAGDSIAMVRNGELTRLRGESVTPNYFDVLRVQPQMGRFFTPEDDHAAAEPAVVISDALWKGQFNRDPHAVGQALEFDLLSPETSGILRSYRIIGVAPAGFTGMANRFQPTEFWAPRTLRLLDNQLARDFRYADRIKLDVLRYGPVSIFFRKTAADGELSAAIETMARQFARERPPEEHAWTLQVHASKRNRLPFDSTGRIVPTRLAAGLMAAAGAVVLIALANLAGLLSARSLTRRSEMAVRTTLGAGAWRLTRQLLAESLLLAAAGGLLGFAIARLLIAALLSALPRVISGSTITVEVPIDWRVLLFTAATCSAAALVVAIAPVRQALARDLLSGLSDGETSATGRSRTRLRELVLLPQVCGSLVLLVLATALMRSVIKEELAMTGYESDDVVLLDYQLQPYLYYRLAPAERRAAQQRREAGHGRLLTFLSDTSGVTAYAFAGSGLGGLPHPGNGGAVMDRETFGTNPIAHGTSSAYVSAGYFETLRIPIRFGRGFTLQDQRAAPRVAVVSEGLARRIWGTPNAVGRYLAQRHPGDSRPPEWLEVVGVAADISLPLTEGAATSILYLSSEQTGFPASTILARGTAEPRALFDRLKTAVLRADPKAFVAQPRLARDTLDALLFPRRAAAAVLGLSGLAGLMLTSVGLYGVVSYSVAQRVREIGIRAALGAERRDVMRLILRDGARIIALGSAIGGAVAFAAIKLTSARIVALPQADAVTIAIAPAILALAMLAAAYIPARRAASVDPMVALRQL